MQEIAAGAANIEGQLITGSWKRTSGGYAWYVAAALCLVHIVAFLDRFLISLSAEPLRHAMLLSDTELGLLQGTGFVLLYAVAGIPLGWVADTNRRNLIAIGIAIWSAATMAAAFCTSFGPLFLTRVVVGVGEACLIPCAMSLLTAYFVKNELGRGISIFGMGAFLGKGIAFLGGGAALAYFTANALTLPGLGSFAPWQGLFLAAGAIGLLMLPLLTTIREPVRKQIDAEGDPRRGIAAGLSHILHHRGAYGVQIGATVIAATMGYAATVWGVSIFVRNHGLTVAQAGVLVGTIALVTGPLANISGGWFLDRLIARDVVGAPPLALAVSIGMAILPALLLCLAPTLIGAAIGYATFQFAMTFALPSSYGGVQLLTPGRYRGIVAAVSLLSYTIVAMGIGPPTVGFLTDHLFRDPLYLRSSLLLTLGVLAAIGLPLALLGRRRFQRDVRAETDWQ